MKILGYMLITAGFLVGALTAVYERPLLEDELAVKKDDEGSNINWQYYGIALTVGVLGVVLVRVADRQQSHAGETMHENMQEIDLRLKRIVENMTALNAQKDKLSPYEYRHRIDELFLEDIGAFVEARQSIAHRYGLQAYADVMSDFAAGERYMNRVWSASADGYIDEVNMYLVKSLEQFKNSLEKVQKLSIEIPAHQVV